MDLNSKITKKRPAMKLKNRKKDLFSSESQTTILQDEIQVLIHSRYSLITETSCMYYH